MESYELMLCLGMVVAQLFDYVVMYAPGSWRWMVGAPMVPGALLLRECPPPSTPFHTPHAWAIEHWHDGAPLEGQQEGEGPR